MHSEIRNHGDRKRERYRERERKGEGREGKIRGIVKSLVYTQYLPKLEEANASYFYSANIILSGPNLPDPDIKCNHKLNVSINDFSR